MFTLRFLEITAVSIGGLCLGQKSDAVCIELLHCPASVVLVGPVWANTGALGTPYLAVIDKVLSDDLQAYFWLSVQTARGKERTHHFL